MRIQEYIGEVSARPRSLSQTKPNSARYFRHENFAYIGGAYGFPATAKVGRIEQHAFRRFEEKAMVLPEQPQVIKLDGSNNVEVKLRLLERISCDSSAQTDEELAHVRFLGPST